MQNKGREFRCNGLRYPTQMLLCEHFAGLSAARLKCLLRSPIQHALLLGGGLACESRSYDGRCCLIVGCRRNALVCVDILDV
jgi:hypothetical protein